MILTMDMEFIIFQMEIDLKVDGKKVIQMDLEYFILL